MKTMKCKRFADPMKHHYYLQGVAAVEAVRIVAGVMRGKRALILWAGVDASAHNLPVVGKAEIEGVPGICDIIAFQI